MANSHDAPKTEEGGALWGMIGEFKSPYHITKAAEMFRDAGYKKWDVYAPVPIHGMDEAMGLKSSRVGWIVGMAAIVGVTGALALQGWTSAVDYQMVVAGKPFFAWEQFTPITFELGVLFAAFGALLSMLAFNKLPMWYHPLFTKERFLRVSDDRFIIAVEAKDAKFKVDELREFFRKAGGEHIETVEV